MTEVVQLRRPRLLSYSEISLALKCFAAWDFQYGGRLAGSTLKQKSVAPLLGDGSAWGAAVAAWHAGMERDPLTASWTAHEALRASYDHDAEWMKETGFPVSVVARHESEHRLGQLLEHYMATTDPMPGLHALEREVVVGVPSRSGKRASTVYRFLAKIDGAVQDPVVNGMQLRGWWIVEFKLRGRLTDLPLLERQRQTRWYAWALQASFERGESGAILPVGVIVDERLNEVPKPAVLTEKGQKVSHKKDQLTTPELYIDLCLDFGVEPKDETVEHLRQRQWQQRHPLAFRPGEMADAGRELTDAAKLIRDLDHGEIRPIRNATRANCSSCRFRTICAEPEDGLFVESMFERTVPKRLRELTKEAA
jgi:hypothetical protein